MIFFSRQQHNFKSKWWSRFLYFFFSSEKEKNNNILNIPRQIFMTLALQWKTFSLYVISFDWGKRVWRLSLKLSIMMMKTSRNYVNANMKNLFLFVCTWLTFMCVEANRIYGIEESMSEKKQRSCLWNFCQ